MRLLRYDWPGNIRELESVIERAVLFCPGYELLPGCLPEEFHSAHITRSTFVIPPLVPMAEIEREAIKQTLERTCGNVKKSAQILRFPRPTFYRKLKKLGIKIERPNESMRAKEAQRPACAEERRVFLTKFLVAQRRKGNPGSLVFTLRLCAFARNCLPSLPEPVPVLALSTQTRTHLMIQHEARSGVLVSH